MARTVADAAILLAVMSGADPTIRQPRPDRRPAVRDGGGDNLPSRPEWTERRRIGVVRDKLFGYSAAADQLADAAIARMKELGATVVDR